MTNYLILLKHVPNPRVAPKPLPYLYRVEAETVEQAAAKALTYAEADGGRFLPGYRGQEDEPEANSDWLDDLYGPTYNVPAGTVATPEAIEWVEGCGPTHRIG